MLRYIIFISLFMGVNVLQAFAAVDSPVQSPARPFGLDIVDTVKLSASDVQSQTFQDNYLPTFTQWASMDLDSQSFIDQASVIALDPSKISLATQYDARVYFVGEKTQYNNTLGFNTGGGGIDTGDPLLIFPDASTKKDRTADYPLQAGDFVDLGTQSAGTQLDFFLIADGAQGGTDIYSTQNSINPDGLSFASVYAVQDSPYLLIGFEDVNRSNRDYTDLVFAVDVGIQNVAALASVPEPSSILLLSSLFLTIGLINRRKKNLYHSEIHS